MARSRNIKPGFYKNEDLAECSLWARFIFPGLWMLADRDGRLEDRPKRIKAEILPFDAQEVEPLLRELAEKEDAEGVPFIVRYQNDDGRFIQISKFSKHQTPHYSEKKSVIKPPTLQEKDSDSSTQNSGSSETTKPQALQEHSENPPIIKRGSQPPDSLNPDSPILRTSDSPNPLGTGSTATSSTARPPLSRAAAVAVLLRNLEKARGKAPKVTSIDPRVQAWAEQGVTDDELREAHALAVGDREANGESAPINAGFLDVFVAKVRTPGNGASRLNGSAAPALEWWTDSAGIYAKAQAEGVEIATRLNVDGEEVRDPKETLARLCAKLGPGSWLDERNATLVRRVDELRRDSKTLPEKAA